MKILAIVVAYNGMKWYDRCLSSLKSSSVPVDIFFIDNASSDGTVEFIKSKYNDVILYESETNLGFGQANNKGFRYTLDNNYDFAFLLNQDAWLAQNDAIEQLIIAYKNNNHFGILSPVHLYGDGLKITKGMKMNLVNNNSDLDMFSDLYFSINLKPIYTVDYVCAAAWLIPVHILKEIGGFDPLFFHYGEDDNYIQRLSYHHYKIGICPYSRICHDVEFRGEDYGKILNGWRKNLLIDMSNINRQTEINQFILKSFFSGFYKILTMKFKSAILNFNMAGFIIQKKRTIKIHNQINRTKGNNWL